MTYSEFYKKIIIEIYCVPADYIIKEYYKDYLDKKISFEEVLNRIFSEIGAD